MLKDNRRYCVASAKETTQRETYIQLEIKKLIIEFNVFSRKQYLRSYQEQ